jgi:ubiquitin-activating enzyme E1 C
MSLIWVCWDVPHFGWRDLTPADTIDVSNLNRQFLFRQADVGKTKAETAARFVEKRVKGVKITPFVGKIQDKDEDYYMQFDIVICGLDSIEARRWINATLVGMVDMNNQKSLKPLVDGGTEGMYIFLVDNRSSFANFHQVSRDRLESSIRLSLLV